MSLQDVAQAAYDTFPATMISTPYGSYCLRVVMTAIAGAEDSFSNGPGDYGTPAGYSQYYCNGYASFGPWQINLPYNHAQVESASGISSSDPCGQATWLQDYSNCAKVALAIYNTAGLSDWCTWGSCRGGAGAGYGPYSQYLDQAQQAISAINNQQQPTPTPSPPVTLPSVWWLAAGAALVAAGLISWELEKHYASVGYGFAHRKPDHGRKDHRINPKLLTYTQITDEVAEEISEPVNICQMLANLKDATAKRGVNVVEGRNIEPGTEAFYTPARGRRPPTIILSSAIAEGARRCESYPAQVEIHEMAHSLLHPPECLPSFRGVSYSSEMHQVEEHEAEEATYAVMLELGLPVEYYDGTVEQPGKREVYWPYLRMLEHPDTYNNIKSATDVIVKAAQGDDQPMVTFMCPAVSGKVVA